MKQKQRREEEMAQLLRERGVKSLLQRLRSNVQSSGITPPETITTSKLISCGDKNINDKSPTKNGKVLINPVPVHINRGSNKESSRKEEVQSPGRPQSILKTSKILSRSLTGISAIDFNE